MKMIKNPNPEKISRRIGGAARMKDSGVVAIMFEIDITPREVHETSLEAFPCGNARYFIEGAYTSGKILDEKLLCFLPEHGSTGYFMALIPIAAMHNVVVSYNERPSLSLLRFYGRMRRKMRKFVRHHEVAA